MKFSAEANLAEGWTSDREALTSALHNHVRTTQPGEFQPRGTALFDALARACVDQFGRQPDKVDPASGANFILLFSDGEDNVGRTTLKQAVEACQRTNTAIYSFRADARSVFTDGPRILEELAVRTGGRVFRENESDAELEDDLRLVESDLHEGYRLIYKPADLKRDGSFHQVAVVPPARVDHVRAKSGYYAPLR